MIHYIWLVLIAYISGKEFLKLYLTNSNEIVFNCLSAQGMFLGFFIYAIIMIIALTKVLLKK